MNQASLHFIDPFSILLVDKNGLLKRLFCPFYVTMLMTGDKERQVRVDVIHKSVNNELKFVVNGLAYVHSRFRIE